MTTNKTQRAPGSVVCTDGLAALRDRLCLAVGLVILGACAPVSAPGAGEAPGDAVSLETLRAEVQARIGEPHCTEPEQCRTIPVGAKPCGGPWSYLVYSVVTTDSVELARAVERYTVREDALNRLEGRVSDCALVTRPGVTCAEGRCVAMDQVSSVHSPQSRMARGHNWARFPGRGSQPPGPAWLSH